MAAIQWLPIQRPEDSRIPSVYVCELELPTGEKKRLLVGYKRGRWQSVVGAIFLDGSCDTKEQAMQKALAAVGAKVTS